MSETKPTSGPWTVEDRRTAPLKNIRIVGPGGHPVGEVSDVHQRDYLGGYDWRRDEVGADAVDARGLANALLIAAAPDLLAACKTAFQTCRIARQDAANIGGTACEEALAFSVALAKLDRAIANAEGR